jgi:putative membrane protein (TIGR04086 family)
MPQKEEKMGRLIFKCALVSLLLTVVIIALLAMLVIGGILPPDKTVAAVLLAEAVGAFVGGRIVSKRAPNRKIVYAALTGLCLFAILLVLGFLFAFPPARHWLFVFPAAVIPALLGGFERAKRPSARR